MRIIELTWLGNVKPTKTRANPNQGRVYDANGMCPAITTIGGGNREPMTIVWKE